MKSTYLIVYGERFNDPDEVVADGLLIGSRPDCDLRLNSQSILPFHAGIGEAEGDFYVTALGAATSVALNGRLIVPGEPEALADGDVLQIGPFFLGIARAYHALTIQVSYQPGLDVVNLKSRPIMPDAGGRAARQEKRGTSPDVARTLELFWEKRTSRLAAVIKSPLRPQQQPPAGKARFNWQPTYDLVRPWPFSVFLWSLLIIGGGLVALARWFPQGYAPGLLSAAHARTALTPGAAVALRPNAGACLTCHGGATLRDRCASCHQTESFAATVPAPHTAAGVDCVTCHAEHRGEDFSPREAALKSCSACHDDDATYAGRRMKTPHPETGFGYPVVGGRWVWKGLDEEEWTSKPAKVREQIGHWPVNNERQRRVAQFHSLHVFGVRSVNGLRGNSEGEISCGTCHKFFEPVIDAETPVNTCATCHDGRLDDSGSRVILAADRPNCTSCHVQHVRDKSHWNPALLTEDARPRPEPSPAAVPGGRARAAASLRPPR